jgi:hypothetical protein
MTSRVLLTRALRVLVAAMLLVTISSGMALAKNPNINLKGTATAVPGIVSAGALVRFDYTITNNSNSNYSSFFVDATTPDKATGGQLVAILVNATVTPSTTAPKACTITSTGDLHCSFGPLNGSGSTASFSVLYRVASNATGTWTVTFAASSNGVSGSDPGNSHGDTVNIPGTVAIGTGKDGGTYVFGDDLTTQNDQNLSKKNPQSSKLIFSSGGSAGFPATVDEAAGSSTLYACPTAVSSSCFGDWNLISANNGGAVPGGSFRVTYGYDKISGSQGNVRFVHLLDPDHDGVYGEGQVAGVDYVVIPSFSSQPCSASSSTGTNCIESISSSGGDYFFTLILDGNGPMRGI